MRYNRIMTSTQDSISEPRFLALIEPVWDFLCCSEEPKPSDTIIVFGGNELLIPRKAARLYIQQLSSTIVSSGSAGPLTRDRFDRSEAEVFAEELIRLGVPRKVILLETRATNTGQNVTYSMELLAEQSGTIGSALLVMKPFLARRCMATFRKQFPSVRTTPCPPEGSPLVFLDRPLGEFALRLTQEVDRLTAYSEQGFIDDEPIPTNIAEGCTRIRELFGS